MAEIKTLQTRIALKHDTWANWHNEDVANQGANLVLLKGEIGFCEIPAENAAATTAPTVLFKVGDGTTPFKSLKWASALAADVYSWAKASDVKLTVTAVEGKTSTKAIEFVGTDKVITLDYLTEAEVTAITGGLAARIAAVEAALGTDDGSENTVSARLDAAEAAIEVLNGEDAGSVKKALADAKAHAESQDAALKTELQGYADQAEADALAEAKKYADAEVLKDRNRIGALEAADSAQDDLISGNTTAIATEKSDREAADALINEKFGADYSKDATVAAAIADAKKAGTDANGAVEALRDGAVATNAENISKNAQDIADEVTRATGVEAGFETRIAKVEAFFDGAAEDSEGLNNALDKLVDIQNFLSGEGSNVDQILDAIDANAKDIDALESVVGKAAEGENAATGLVKDAAEAKADIADLKDDVAALQDVVDGYTGKSAIKTAVDAAKEQADKGVEDAAKAQKAAEDAAAAAKNAQDDVDALELVVGNAESGVIADVAKNTSDISAVAGRMATAEGEIDALQDVVLTGADKNEALRADITELQGIVKTGADANATLRTDLTNLKNAVEHETTGLAATKGIADQNKTDIGTLNGKVAAIEADYLKVADWFIIDCGTSVLREGEPTAK